MRLNTILEYVGKTPLVRLNKCLADYPGNYYAKLEAHNPGHSNKDRIAVYIIKAAEKKGILKKGGTIIETTSGNTGFSLSMVAAVMGYKCLLAVSSKSSKDKIAMMRAMGAEVYVCPADVPADHPESYYEVAKRLHKKHQGALYVNQYHNQLNTEAHYKTTAPEIWEQLQGNVTHFVACSGTGGTISGCAKYFKEKNPDVVSIGVDACGSVLKNYHETGEIDPADIYPYLIEGVGKSIIPTTTDFTVIDYFEKVSDEASAYASRNITKTEGIFAGYTCGAVVQAVKQLQEKNFFNKHSHVVMIFADHGSRYLSKIYSDQWMKDNGFSLTKQCQ